jgi:hypothetical protein
MGINTRRRNTGTGGRSHLRIQCQAVAQIMETPTFFFFSRNREVGGPPNHRFSSVTVYLLNGRLLEYAQQMAAHESARTTKLYDRRNDQVTLDQVEQIVL